MAIASQDPAAAKFADTAVRQALKRLGDDRVAQRKTGNELEYWIAGKGDADLRRNSLPRTRKTPTSEWSPTKSSKSNN